MLIACMGLAVTTICTIATLHVCIDATLGQWSSLTQAEAGYRVAFILLLPVDESFLLVGTIELEPGTSGTKVTGSGSIEAYSNHI